MMDTQRTDDRVTHAPSVTVALIGDSTVTVQSGWGGAFAETFKRDVKVLNFAAGGRSSKSWQDENRLPEVLRAKPDYVLIQFGHNDQPGKGPQRETDPTTSYRDYLRLYVKEFRKIGATVIILSSMTRRTFGEDGKIKSTLTPWADAARHVARELKVPFIDLHALSVDLHNALGRQASMAFNPEEGDMTHLNRAGADAIANIVARELKTAVPQLATYLK